MAELCYIPSMARPTAVENSGSIVPAWFIKRLEMCLQSSGLIVDCPESSQSHDLELTTAQHTYDRPGRYTVAVKVIDIFGNDTMSLVPVNVG